MQPLHPHPPTREMRVNRAVVAASRACTALPRSPRQLRALL